ncbi:hypothetical protein BD779DRAFT_1452040, partial [Infundibulicybe gibba]
IVDAHLGRLDIIYIAFGILLPGHIILIIAAVPGATGAFSVALMDMPLDTGLFKANISPPVAE